MLLQFRGCTNIQEAEKTYLFLHECRQQVHVYYYNKTTWVWCAVWQYHWVWGQTKWYCHTAHQTNKVILPHSTPDKQSDIVTQHTRQTKWYCHIAHQTNKVILVHSTPEKQSDIATQYTRQTKWYWYTAHQTNKVILPHSTPNKGFFFVYAMLFI